MNGRRKREREGEGERLDTFGSGDSQSAAISSQLLPLDGDTQTGGGTDLPPLPGHQRPGAEPTLRAVSFAFSFSVFPARAPL